jgi:hypothetical protein
VDGSGTSVTLELDGDVLPSQALVLFIAYTPGITEFVRSDILIGDTYRPVNANVYLPGGGELDLDTDLKGPTMGMGEWEMAFSRGYLTGSGAMPIDGFPAPVSFYSIPPPTGYYFASTVLQHSEAYSSLDIYLSRSPSRTPYAVDWCHVKAWLFDYPKAESFSSGFVGTGSVEGHVEGGLDWDLSPHAVPAGISYHGDCDPGEDVRVSDGGDVDGSCDPASMEQPTRKLELGMVAYYGTIETDGWEWDDWPGTQLDVVDITGATDYGDVRAEFFYNIPTTPAPDGISIGGTFGPQEADAQSLFTTPEPPDWEPNEDFPDLTWRQLYRNAGPDGNAAIRSASIQFFAQAGGGWLPQIYRRMVESEVG